MPNYWMNESSGVLKPAVESYLRGGRLDQGQVRLMRAYLLQWVLSPVWMGGDELEALQAGVRAIKTETDVRIVIEKAIDLGMDPL